MAKLWKYYDYAYKPYKPLTSSRGKLSSNELFYNSCAQSPFNKDYLSLSDALRKALGPWSTVWGCKLCRGVLTWELYFYDHGINNSWMTVTQVLKVLRPFFKTAFFVENDMEKFPYFMFSFDLNDGILKERRLDGMHLYTRGRRGVFQGNSYLWDKNGWRLENLYDFYRMPSEVEDCIHKVRQSVVLSGQASVFLKNELVHRLMDCGTVCVANKPLADGVYFSRVTVEQLIVFLKWFSYPPHILDFVCAYRHKLDHLLFDVALDCTVRSGEIVFEKSSYYSIF